MAGSHKPLGLHSGHGVHGGWFIAFVLAFPSILTSLQVWVSPVVENVPQSTQYGDAYHGYWAQDIYQVNPHFGTAANLVALSSALHARGMV